MGAIQTISKKRKEKSQLEIKRQYSLSTEGPRLTSLPSRSSTTPQSKTKEIKLLTKKLETSIKKKGEVSPLQIEMEIAKVYEQSEEWQSARNSYNKIILSKDKYGNVDDENKIQLLVKIAQTYFEENESSKGLEKLFEAIKISISPNRESNLMTAQLYDLISEKYLMLENYQEAIRYSKISIEIKNKFIINEKNSLLLNYLRMARAYFSLSLLLESFRYYKLALVYNDDSLEDLFLLEIYYRLSLILFSRGYIYDASIYSQTAYDNLEGQKFFMNQNTYLELFENHLMILNKLEKFSQIKACCENALNSIQNDEIIFKVYILMMTLLDETNLRDSNILSKLNEFMEKNPELKTDENKLILNLSTGNYYKNIKKDFNKAIEYYNASLKTTVSFQDEIKVQNYIKSCQVLLKGEPTKYVHISFRKISLTSKCMNLLKLSIFNFADINQDKNSLIHCFNAILYGNDFFSLPDADKEHLLMPTRLILSQRIEENCDIFEDSISFSKSLSDHLELLQKGYSVPDELEIRAFAMEYDIEFWIYNLEESDFPKIISGKSINKKIVVLVENKNGEKYENHFDLLVGQNNDVPEKFLVFNLDQNKSKIEELSTKIKNKLESKLRNI